MTKKSAIWTGAKAALLVCAVAGTAVISWSHIAVGEWRPASLLAPRIVEGN